MANIKRANASGITKSGTAIADVPDAPTIGTATGGQAAATVTFTAAATGGTPTTYTATSSPGSITGTASSSPITISGLTNGTAYTFTVTATNSTGTSKASSASNSVTPVSLGDMDPIAMVEVGSSGSSSITFSSIPQTYTHLQLRYISRDARTAYNDSPIDLTFNGSSATAYAKHFLQGDGSSAIAGSETSQTYLRLEGAGNNTLSSAFGAGVTDILDYTSTTKNKTVRQLFGVDKNGNGIVRLVSGLWYATPAAITSITLTPYSSPFAQYSHFALYGIKGA